MPVWLRDDTCAQQMVNESDNVDNDEVRRNAGNEWCNNLRGKERDLDMESEFDDDSKGDNDGDKESDEEEGEVPCEYEGKGLSRGRRRG